MAWTDRARALLNDAQRADGAWGYRPQGQPFSEPTALAALACLAHEAPQPSATDWLAKLQQSDGSVPITPDRAEPRWPTALATLAWQAEARHDASTERAVSFLLGQRGKTWRSVGGLGHDTSIVGWPWVTGTHSWVEPTSYALCALARAGRGEDVRATQGRALLLDRVVSGGGWNYGNTRVLGSDLAAYPAPTGVALLATLPKLRAEPRIQASVEFLERQAQTTRSPASRAWTLLGLEAAGRAPALASAWLEESFARLQRREPRVLDLALLLLASRAKAAVKLLGGAA